MTDVTESAELLIFCATGAAHLIPGVPRLLKIALLSACLAAFIALQFRPLELPINNDTASWLSWFSLAMLAPLFYFGVSREFDRKWTVPDREPERD
jgi:hypothetical protein